VLLDAVVNVAHERTIAKFVVHGRAIAKFDSKKFAIKKRVMEKNLEFHIILTHTHTHPPTNVVCCVGH
jgi:hypothetical protein